MRTLDASDLGSNAFPFEVDRTDPRAGTPSHSVYGFPRAPESVAPTGGTMFVRRCHVHGLALDEFAECQRCQTARAEAAQRASRRAIVLVVMLGMFFASLVGLFFAWRHYNSTTQARAAYAITQRYENKVVVYTSQSCGACQVAKAHLDAKKIPYVERSLDGDITAMPEFETLGVRSLVPTFVVGDEVIQGFDTSGMTLARAMQKHGAPMKKAEGEDELE
ncbi:MAG: glutaredoxin family protein [Polyangiaceae bacterium]